MVRALIKALIVLGPIWLTQTGAGEIKRYVVEGSQAAGLAACVEPTERMRRMHMEFIKHQRIITVHRGVRDTKYSLAGCIDCHVSYDDQRNPQPINRPDQFCGACHRYAAVKLDCFDCHAAVPNRPSRQPPLQAGTTSGGGQ